VGSGEAQARALREGEAGHEADAARASSAVEGLPAEVSALKARPSAPSPPQARPPVPSAVAVQPRPTAPSAPAVAAPSSPPQAPPAPAAFASLIVADFPPLLAEFRGKRLALLWRGSRDGFGARDFHKRCDGHANTLVLIQDTVGNIFGGFTPVEWDTQCLRCQSPRLWRSTKGYARKHRHPHRWTIPSEDLGIKLENVTIDDLSRTRRITVGKEDTTIVEGNGSHNDIQARIKQIRYQIDESTSDYDHEKRQERLIKLAGGVTIIRVGATTEPAMKETKDRVNDAFHAPRAAVEEGISARGSVALLRASAVLISSISLVEMAKSAPKSLNVLSKHPYVNSAKMSASKVD
jgi:hypothetical protein